MRRAMPSRPLRDSLSSVAWPFGGQRILILPRLSGRRFELEDFGKRGPAPA